MIKGNYSLAREVRKNESKQRRKIQERQKHDNKLEQLREADPVRIYFSIEKLEQLPERDTRQQERLAKLKSDWAFIRKNNLFQDKLGPFLEGRKKAQEAREKASRKLHGKASVYFNPELNPFGKVPDANRVTIDETPAFTNITKPVKNPYKYDPDPLIAELGIRPPPGEPPKFFKAVQNVKIAAKEPQAPEPTKAVAPKKQAASAVRSKDLDSDSDYESRFGDLSD